jgi:hypothetical protein
VLPSGGVLHHVLGALADPQAVHSWPDLRYLKQTQIKQLSMRPCTLGLHGISCHWFILSPAHSDIMCFTYMTQIFFFRFPNLFAICIYIYIYIYSNTISKLCVEKRGRVEECSVAPLRDKRVKTLCGCRGKKGTN